MDTMYIYRGDYYTHKANNKVYMVSNISKLGYKKEVIIELKTLDYSDIKRITTIELANTFRETIKTKSKEGYTILN